MSDRTRNLVTAVAIMVMALAMAGSQFSLWWQARKLSGSRMVASGQVLDARLDKVEGWLDVSYAPQGEGPRRAQIKVAREFALRMVRGEVPRQVQVRYLASRPEVADVQGASGMSAMTLLFSAAVMAYGAWLWRKARS